jgi:DNA-binding PadR family transcriptional regulator
VSSIRLFVLGAFAENGAMHGHALRLLAEQEHIDRWADVAGSAIYGALKRLAAEGLLAEVRTEREGNYPERQVYDITDDGRAVLDELRLDAIRDVVVRPDPVDLGLARIGPVLSARLPELLGDRLAELRLLCASEEQRNDRIAQYLTPMERMVVSHKVARIRADIAWHEELVAALPEIVAHERSRGAAPLPSDPATPSHRTDAPA